ncbi:MAG TPA: hypothetical protein VD846_05010 [Allosphingosinicella sp.]|nr:hypothetical protein [Allosphingosinicella sp.]
MASDPDQQELNFAKNSWGGIDGQLGPAIVAAIRRARGIGLVPTIFERKARPTNARAVAALPAVARKALSDAGHHAGSLAGLLLSDLGQGASRLTLEHVDLLHREALSATYRGTGLPRSAVARMVALRMPAWEMLDFIEPCSGLVAPRPGTVASLPIDWRRAIDRDRLIAGLRRNGSPYRPTPFPVPQPRPQPGPDWHAPFGEDRPIRSIERAVDLLGAGDVRPFLGQLGGQAGPAAPSFPGSLLATAYGLAMKGDNPGALRIAGLAASGKDDGKSDSASYQRLVIAPAFAAAVADDSRTAIAASRAALKGTTAGTAAQTIAHRAAVRAAASEARRARAAAKGGGAGRRARKRGAVEATIGVATAEHLEGLAARPGAALETAAAMLDLYRAYAAAMNGISTSPSTLRHGRPTFPRDDRPSASDILQRGPSAYLGDPTIRLHAFDSFLHLHRLCAREPACGAWNLFRFDYLADESRKLLDDLARIDQLSVELIEMLRDAAVERIGATDAFRQQLAALLQRLVSDINAAAGRLRDTVAAAVPRLRELGALQAIYDLLKNWPWQNWATVIEAIGAAFAAGTDPAIAARDALAARMGGSLQSALSGAKSTITGALGAVEALVSEPLSSNAMATLRAELSVVLTPEALTPLDHALDAIKFVAVAQPILDEIDAADVSAEIPAWLQTLLLAYVAAPFVAALAVAAPAIILRLLGVEVPFVGAIAASVCAFLVTALVQLGVSLVLQLLAGLLSRTLQITAEVNRLVNRLDAIGNDLVASLATTAMIQSALDALNALLARLDDAFPPEINSALSDAVLAARTALRLDLGTVLKAAEESFFRETLEIVEVLPQLEDASPSGMHDPGLGYSNRLAAALSRFEAERIRRMTEPAQVLTQVLSLRQLLAGTAEEIEQVFEKTLLKAENVLSFNLDFIDLDRIAPGLHRQMIRDVQLQIDFDLDSVGLPVASPSGAPITAADAVAAIVGENNALAGGLSDPALDGAVPGGGFKGLPVVAGRLPTGIPALLTHGGISTFRIRGPQSIAEAAERGSRLVTGATLEPDPQEELAFMKWWRLTICEPPQSHLFSHFRVLEDGVRFFNPGKEIHPFEFRSVIGNWSLEIPAVKLGFVTPKLPKIRDVRLIFSTIARYDRDLASAIRLPPLAVPVNEPDLTREDDVLDLLADPQSLLNANLAKVAALLEDLLKSMGVIAQLPELISGLRDQVGALGSAVETLGRTTQATAAAVGEMQAEMEAALAATRTELAARVASLESAVEGGFASLGGDIGSLGEKLEDLEAISTTTAGLISGLPNAGGAAARKLRIITFATTDASILTGAPKAWTVDQAMLAGRGIDGGATVAWVAVTALPSAGSAVGGLIPGTTAPSWPAAPATLSLAPASGGPARSAQLVFDSPTASVDGATLGGGSAPVSPLGTWTLDLPPGMPALSEAVVALFLETL